MTCYRLILVRICYNDERTNTKYNAIFFSGENYRATLYKNYYYNYYYNNYYLPLLLFILLKVTYTVYIVYTHTVIYIFNGTW